ncbi:transcriptional regulator [Saccharothrix violaceirubra]|uniref:Uncharacterized protein n=1 Tax=Saccharothrix violaceirubra TaxID=413306 RepID=A0A7W7T3R6_9PSEU|nr:transcriptional regulator [Saccharothrix violaceirubra]MBB4965756.1 hypothetical protein [Saccharothrix violaceirubra]
MFDKAARLAGHPSDYSVSQAMGVNRSTVTRVRAGTLHPGPAFIAGALRAFPPLTFEDLFECFTDAPPARPGPSRRPENGSSAAFE